jgi:hypothetical protein
MFVRKSLRPTLFSLLIAALFLASCSIGAAPEPTVDVNAINTAAVATAMGQLSAQFTQTALVAPSATPQSTNTAISLPTFAQPTTGSAVPTTSGALPTVSFNSTPNTTPLAGFTALPTSAGAGAPTASLGDSCNNSAFEGDVTIPDGTVLPPGENFEKTWTLRNTGSCTWDDGYSLVYIAGSTPNLDPYNFEFDRSADFVAAGSAINMTLTLTTPCRPGEYEGHWRMRSDSGYYFGTLLSVYVKVEDDC